MPTTPKKKNPTQVRKTIDGKTTIYTDPKTGIKHVTYETGAQIRYFKYNKDGSFAGGNTQNTSVFGAKDGGKRIPITPEQYKKMVEDKGRREIEEEYGKDYATKNKKEVKKEVKTGTGQNVAELWKKTTGTSWAEAKKQGLTDGSLKNNLALMAKLKSGEYKPKAKEEVKVEPKVEPKPYVPAGFPARTDGPIADGEQLNEMRRGGRVMTIKKPKMAMGGAKKIVLKKPVKKAMYGTAMKPMKPTMMQMGGAKKYLTGGTTGTPKRDDQTKKATTLKKAMYGTMMKPKMMIKGSTKKK